MCCVISLNRACPMKKSIKTGIIFFFLLIIFLVLLYTVRPPGRPISDELHRTDIPEKDKYKVNTESLPGVTWVDDVHPIFVRNKCGHCHTRGKEVIAEGLEPFALGIIDPGDKKNAYYSYHELVYAEGEPQIQEGETLRDGQCCWPLNYPAEHQRRIWIGHPERSTLMRKLDRDYYDWRKPPRFFEEGLNLLWGAPMPMYHIEKEDGGSDHQRFEIRPFYKRLLLHMSLWLGGSRSELHRWPPRIPASDRDLLRHWINNAIQVKEEGTGIEISVVYPDGKPAHAAVVRLIGNFNSKKKREVTDQIALKTDKMGKAILLFPIESVITSIWFVSSEKNEFQTAYKPLYIIPGKITKITLKYFLKKRK
jgi:hypothetical protein